MYFLCCLIGLSFILTVLQCMSKTLHHLYIPIFFVIFIIFFISKHITVIIMLNKIGVDKIPCRTPVLVLKHSKLTLFAFTHMFVWSFLLYHCLFPINFPYYISGNTSKNFFIADKCNGWIFIEFHTFFHYLS